MAAPLSSASSIRDVVTWVIHIIDILIPVLTLLALALFLWGVLKFIFKSEESGLKGPEREAIWWGLIALFVLTSVWGLLRIMCVTFIGNAMCS